MTPMEIVVALVAGGAFVERRGDRVAIKGPHSAELVAAIRNDREAFLDAWDTYQTDRFCVAPPPDLPMRRESPVWRKEVAARVHRYVMRQEPLVPRWVIERGADYQNAFPKWNSSQCINAALSDVLHWQLARHKKPEDILEGFEEVAKIP